MSKMKELQQYLTIRCPMWEDLTRAECKEFDVDFEDFECQFLTHKLSEDGSRVTYTYQCNNCGTTHEREFDVESDFVYIGECPSDEDPFRKYTTMQTCMALREQLREVFGPEPEGARLAIKYEAGADGYTVICVFTMAHPMSYAYAMKLEGNLPEKWSPKAIKILENLTGKPHREKWIRFWFESNVIWGYIDNLAQWSHVVRTLHDNGYETAALDARRVGPNRFEINPRESDGYTLRDFFRDNNMTP